MALRERGDVWGAFTILAAEYKRNPSQDIAIELSKMIGTTTDYADVLAAMASEFDNAHYLHINSDVRGATSDGATHYLLYGWKENRPPSPFFDPYFYRHKYQDLDPRVFLLSHFLKNGKVAGTPANAISDEYWFVPTSPTSEEWRDAPAAKLSARTKAVVIIPVYKGYEETMTSVYQALVSRQNDEYSLLVVNDKGPDEKLNKELQALSDRGLFDYHASVINRGFVQTCNHAIKELSNNLDVVLLNSDAYVFPGWFKRLSAHANDPNVATVTPLSNNATICSYPVVDRDNFLSLECSPQELDAFAKKANKGLAVETPTGVGFCFYMSRAVINKIGALDADAFKVGYGEENDFCMRALNHGYKNLIAGDVFVFHTGSVSFSAIKEENFNKGQRALEGKHPNYSPLVRSHVMADPERYMRRQLDVARLSSALKGATVFVTHAWSGGINTYLNHERRELDNQKLPHVTIKVHSGYKITVDTNYGLFVPNLVDIDLRTELGVIKELIESMSPKEFHVNSFAGLDWQWHKKLLEFIQSSGKRYKYVCHDYSSISHHYQLLRPDNIYRHAPTIAERRAWSTMIDGRDSPDVSDPDERLAAYTVFLENAAVVEVPSNAAKRILEAEFPKVAFSIVPHADHLPDVPIAQRRQRDGKIRVAVIGAIGPHKGSDVLASLAVDARNRNLELEYVLVGYSNNDNLLQSCGISITGQYRTEGEALAQLSELKPDMVLIPSIWPETFCYALSMALKLKIPPVVFDIGAQADRVSPLSWGKTLPIKLAYDPCRLSESLLRLDLDKMWRSRTADHAADRAA
ncbi:GT2 family glycosyltransferase [Rhizobium sp. BK313]|uniref:glycosyltransferase n=1 Tax=Rhizobium sp. BK313 TaxID=2587081 RepID=UPI00161145BE|nr:glycosyltransferase [Rhizobium sp. BK313]MBB3453879.1 GT2 family glycosyltransferase [Rhizobium sp. BK313]